MATKLPSIQFYPGDWRKDPGVQALDYFDRGVWFEILLLMFEAKTRGILTINGAPMSDESIAKILGIGVAKFRRSKQRILDLGVADIVTEGQYAGALMSRRMVRDEEISNTRREAGKKGGNPILVKQNESKAEILSKQNPTPSSSSSSSSSRITTTTPNTVPTANAEPYRVVVVELEKLGIVACGEIVHAAIARGETPGSLLARIGIGLRTIEQPHNARLCSDPKAVLSRFLACGAWPVAGILPPDEAAAKEAERAAAEAKRKLAAHAKTDEAAEYAALKALKRRAREMLDDGKPPVEVDAAMRAEFGAAMVDHYASWILEDVR